MAEGILHEPRWGQSAQGRDIELFRKTHTNSPAPLLFIGGVHGDEPEGVRLAQDLLQALRNAEGRGLSLPSWILIPCLNPDGFLSNERTNGHGVDLNRNFPSKDWSRDASAPRYYPGPFAGSEPEVAALSALILEARPRVIFHFHSWVPCVVCSGENSLPWGEPFAKSSGYKLQEDIGYPTPGSLGQYGALDLRTPVICLEAQAGDDLDAVWPRFKAGFETLLGGIL